MKRSDSLLDRLYIKLITQSSIGIIKDEAVLSCAASSRSAFSSSNRVDHPRFSLALQNGERKRHRGFLVRLIGK
jgi:hypothetical protein